MKLWQLLAKRSFLLTLLACLAWQLGRWKGIELPESPDIVPALAEAPDQTATSQQPFSFTWRNTAFRVSPKAEYDIRGLIVSHNDPTGWGDIYHDENSVDVRDLCLVWGGNTRDNTHRAMTYASGPWTCHVTGRGEAAENFAGDELSNNHILAGTERIAQSLRDARIGDQIEMEGFLVDYHPIDDPGMVRSTSLTRDDSGNGACEVVFVTRFHTLARANHGWRRVQKWGKRSTMVIGIFWLISFLTLPYLEYRAMDPRPMQWKNVFRRN